MPHLVTMMVGRTPWRELGYNPDRCYSLVAEHLDEIQVAADGEDRPAGFLRWRPDWFLGQPYLHLLAVAPERQRQGIGRMLLRWLETEVFERRGAANLFLCVSAFNGPARALYAGLGYEEIGLLRDYLRPGFDEVLLRKSVRPLLAMSQSG